MRGLFLSSRRRHTSWPRDWSSDVCSSDLWIWMTEQKGTVSKFNPRTGQKVVMLELEDIYLRTTPGLLGMDIHPRSEERRVGKECRARWGRLPEMYEWGGARGASQ